MTTSNSLPDDPWSVPASEKTKRLAELIREVYDEARSTKADSNG